MMPLPNTAFESINGKPITLLGIDVHVQIIDLLSHSRITQTYRNDESVNIEAVYAFPLPLDATLLGLEVRIGDKVMQGNVLAKAESKKKYEKSLEDGNSAVLLECPQPGFYTMNLGNLLPGETAVIKLNYAQIHSWQQQQMRFFLPTTIAPRYGDPIRSGFEPHQVPQYSMVEDRRYSLVITVEGSLAAAKLNSPTHHISVQNLTGKTIIALAEESAIMDRDFVLLIDAPSQAPSSALAAKDIEGFLVWAAFNPQFGEITDDKPRSIKIVVDCSGSMNGDSIQQAAKAVNRILQSLKAQDYFSVTRFGSHHSSLFDRQVPATAENIARAASIHWNPDMGGTEMGSALDHVYQLPSSFECRHDVLLITDGEVNENEPLIKKTIKSGHRLFTIGVGSAVAEALLRQLAEKTGGACELVTPNENMAERILRHYARIYAPSAERVSVAWPGKSTRQNPPKFLSVFSGDTLHLFGWFESSPEGDVTLRIQSAGGVTCDYIAKIQTNAEPDSTVPTTLARLAAATLLKEESNDAQTASMAVQYQIMSSETNYFLSLIREPEEQATDLPELRMVAQRTAAGWHGLGSVKEPAVFSCRLPGNHRYNAGIDCCPDYYGPHEEDLADPTFIISNLSGLTIFARKHSILGRLFAKQFASSIQIVRGDITILKVDAIVNAANSSLMGGGGVDGAIHKAAGPELLAECKTLNGCPTGEAKITRGYKLRAKFVIHAVGPVWRGGLSGEPEALASCYRKSLELAVENNLRTIAFPAISTGVYRYPLDQATRIAIETVASYLKETSSKIHVKFCCFTEEDYEEYVIALRDIEYALISKT